MLLIFKTNNSKWRWHTTKSATINGPIESILLLKLHLIASHLSTLSFQQRWEVGDNDLPVLIQYHLEIFHKTVSTTTKRVRGMKKAFLGAGFNSFERHQSNWIISPSKGENKKYLKHHPGYLDYLDCLRANARHWVQRGCKIWWLKLLLSV